MNEIEKRYYSILEENELNNILLKDYDSIDVLNLIMSLELEFGVHFDDDTFFALTKRNSHKVIIDYINTLLNEK